MIFFRRFFLLIFLYTPSVFASEFYASGSDSEANSDPAYETYKAQSLIPQKDVPRYDRDTFHPKKAKSFDLDTTYLAFPATTGRRDLFKRLLRNDVMLMFYLSKNTGMTDTDKLAVRLQAFDIVYGFFQELQEEETEEAIPLMKPLFKFAGGNIMRLHTLTWTSKKKHPRALSKTGKTIVFEGDIMLCKEEITEGETLKYARFMSIKERGILAGTDPALPRSQQKAGERTGRPKSFRHQKGGFRLADYQ